MRYDARYGESVRLRDGRRAHLRLIRPDDKPLLEAGFQALSPETRYKRFFAHKQALTARDLAYLTETDGDTHLAVGVLDAAGGTGLGVARFIREADPTRAEAAVVVVDAFQGLGVGQLLLERLGEAAQERGIRTLRFTAMAFNQDLFRLVHRTFTHVMAGPVEDGTRTLAVTLAAPASPLREARRAGQWLHDQQLVTLEALGRTLRWCSDVRCVGRLTEPAALTSLRRRP